MAEKTDMNSHVATYSGMIGLLKWGSVGVAILTAIVIWLIAA